jgi:hypothetical protein
MVEILVLAADIDHAVDRAGAAQHLAARPEHLAPGGTGIGLGLVAPVDRGIGEGLAEAEWDVDPAIGVLAAGFEQQHLGRPVFREPRGDRAAGRAGADDDEIGFDDVLRRRHVVLPDGSGEDDGGTTGRRPESDRDS